MCSRKFSTKTVAMLAKQMVTVKITSKEEGGITRLLDYSYTIDP
jgi:hypothetical protein